MGWLGVSKTTETLFKQCWLFPSLHSEGGSVERQKKASSDLRSLKGGSSYEEVPTPAQLHVDLRQDGGTHSGTVC